MKIVAVIENDIAAGGGFNQSLSAVKQMRTVCESRFEFEVLTTCPGNVSYLEQLGIQSQHVGIRLRDTLLIQWAQSSTWRAVQRRIRYFGPLERRLVAMGCDLAYFVSPSPLPMSLQRLNYIITVWDLCHRDFPEFPEVRSFGELEARERMLRSVLPAAYAVIADSEQLAHRINRLYGIDLQRVIAMPFSPAPLMHSKLRSDLIVVLQKYQLRPGYFFYPSQLWAHKNHQRILQAAAILKQQGVHVDLVFAGGGGTAELPRLRDAVLQLGLRDSVRFLGFVPNEEMAALYDGSRAVVMPTYFGPTNLPPLEAWASRRPLIYSMHLAEQAGDAAILVDPDDATSLANGMRQSLDAHLVGRLVDSGIRRLKDIEAARGKAEQLLADALQRFSLRMQTWS